MRSIRYRRHGMAKVMAIMICFTFTLSGVPGMAQAQVAPPVASLKDVPVPEPANLSDFVKDKTAAIALGKALFWDMQVGSDSVQACASCHSKAGADSRTKNQLDPGLNAGDNTLRQCLRGIRRLFPHRSRFAAIRPELPGKGQRFPLPQP